jgi:hypothetical protein
MPAVFRSVEAQRDFDILQFLLGFAIGGAALEVVEVVVDALGLPR